MSTNLHINIHAKSRNFASAHTVSVETLETNANIEDNLQAQVDTAHRCQTSASFATTTLKVNPLFLPEILVMVAQHLQNDKQTICVCLRVSKDFKHVFERLLWVDLEIRGKDLKSPGFVPLDRVRSNAHLVQNLTFHCNALQVFASLHFPNLTRLHFFSNREAENHWMSNLDSIPRSFVERHAKTLQELQLKAFPMIDNAVLFWKAVSTKVPGLKILRLINIHIALRDNMKAFWELCVLTQSLEELHLNWIHMYHTGGAAKVVQTNPSRLRKITLDRVGCEKKLLPRIADLLESSPNLSHLSSILCTTCPPLRSPEDDSEDDEEDDDDNEYYGVLDSILPPPARRLFFRGNQQWPRLTQLEFQDSWVSDQDTASVLTAFEPELKNLSLSWNTVGPRTLQALTNSGTYARTLTSLNLLRCEDLTSLMVHSILCACSGLKSIKADGILSSDLATTASENHHPGGEFGQARPWVCKDLEEWQITMYLDRADSVTQYCVFERLSSLTKLRVLDLSHNWNSKIGRIPSQSQAVLAISHFPLRAYFLPKLELRHHRGMVQLSALQDLRVLRFEETDQIMEKDDWEWLLEKETFPWLREVVGEVNKKAKKTNDRFSIRAKKRQIRYKVKMDREEFNPFGSSLWLSYPL